MSNHTQYINRCLQLAEKAKVYPNPMVGSVVVYKDKIIGEGYHKVFGEAHAEVNAINSVVDKELLKESTLYVNLEPCCHWGKTPPCTQLIIDTGIKNVVVGNLDPNPLVAGKGLRLLEEAGVNVTSGILEQDCLNLNHLFFDQFKANKTVKFILKWAESADGFMGKEIYLENEDRELSNSLVKRFVHKLRSQTDAILIGTNTALVDNPVLDNRFWFGKIPTAIVIDRNLEIPLNSNLFNPKRKVIVINETMDLIGTNIVYVKINFRDKNNFWPAINTKLLAFGIASVLLEGGSKTLQSFIDSKLPCKMVRIRTNKLWHNGIKSPIINIKPKDSFKLGDNLIEMFSS